MPANGRRNLIRRLKVKHQDPITHRHSDISQRNGILSCAAVKTEQNRQCTYNATLRRFRVAIVAVEKQ